MLASGVTEDEWLDFWDDRAKVGKRFTVLKFMQEAYAAQAFRERREPNESESLPTTADLIAAGVIPAPTEEETAAMVASRPAWFNAQLAAQA